MYIHTNITTCSVTQSQCPVFLFFFILLIYFLKILMCWSSAGFSGWFRLKGKSRAQFDIIISTKYVFLFRVWRGWGDLQPGNPPSMRPWFEVLEAVLLKSQVVSESRLPMSQAIVAPSSWISRSWRWRRDGPSKRRLMVATGRGVTSQKTWHCVSLLASHSTWSAAAVGAHTLSLGPRASVVWPVGGKPRKRRSSHAEAGEFSLSQNV
jgi:hypothetical protein